MLRDHKWKALKLTPSAELLLNFILKETKKGDSSDSDTDEEPKRTSKGSKPKVKNDKTNNNKKKFDARTANKNRRATSSRRR